MAAPHVLVVDDNQSVRRLLQLHLEHAGYRVSTARDGQDALDRMGAEVPDLLLLDHAMPGLTGLALLDRLRAEQRTAELPVLMISGKADAGDVAAAWRGGADFFLPKPFHPAELLMVVRRFLEAAPAPALLS